jgi:CRISPR-associated protein Csb2
VEVPAGCPFQANDVFWAFSGLRIQPDRNGPILASSDESEMLKRYSAEKGANVWRSITPAALPDIARRRRIEPSRRISEAKPASERFAEQTRAAHAVASALRHAGVQNLVSDIVVQREPFHGNGERVERFAEESRFPKERLWHIQITFSEPYAGLLIVGDGRFCGLGIMVPIS